MTVHVLCEGQHEDSSVLSFVRSFKQRTAFDHSKRTGRRLWQDGYYEHVVRHDEAAAAIARYVLENPVRAGLAQCPSAYEFCGSLTMTRDDLVHQPAWSSSRHR